MGMPMGAWFLALEQSILNWLVVVPCQTVE
jgi:hypothetical protein